MIKFANIYSDNMIFQQGKPIRLWGFCDTDTAVTAEIIENGKAIAAAEAKPANGKWYAELEALGVKRELEVSIRQSGENAVLKNTAVGEVWLCSGQSNIECGFDYCTGAEEYIEGFDSCDIRFMDIEQAIAFEPRENAEDVRWVRVDAESCMPLSTVGCVFAQRLAKELDIPVGIVKNYRGGNSIVSYLSAERLAACDTDGIFAAQLEREKKELKAAWSMIPTGFYNAMTAPLAPFSFKGMLWYQGETDSAYARPDYYAKCLKELIAQQRELFRDEELPVLLVQLCPFGQDPFDYKKIRQIQLETALADENIRLIVTAELGPTGAEGESPIHPKYKTPIGERCAAAALAEVYRMTEAEWSGPLIKNVTAENGDLLVHFSHCGEGLRSEGELSGFEIGSDEFFINGTPAEILNSDTVVIRNAARTKILQYSYVNLVGKNRLSGSLTNETGVPASPFRIKIN